ncbi:MAG: 5'-nucleotidase C-terminal domain-containing protein, partial [Armatimonadota bacterium]
PDVAAIVADYQSQLDDAIKRVVGHAEVPLNGAREDVRSGETNLGNAITDAMRLVSGAPIALHNGGGIRASIDEGPITLEDVLQVLPFGNEVATLELTGAQLREILQRSISEPRPHGGFLHVSGLTVVAEGDRLVSVMVGDEELDDGETYTVATMLERNWTPRSSSI